MAFIQLECGKLTKDKKLELMMALSKTAGGILGVNPKEVLVLINENETDNIKNVGEQEN